MEPVVTDCQIGSSALNVLSSNVCSIVMSVVAGGRVSRVKKIRKPEEFAMFPSLGESVGCCGQMFVSDSPDFCVS